MSWEDWSPLQRCISENWCNGAEDLADALIEAGYVAADRRRELVELLAPHAELWADGDSEYDAHCSCGKWIELGQYDMPDHLSAVLDDEHLVLTEDGAR